MKTITRTKREYKQYSVEELLQEIKSRHEIIIVGNIFHRQDIEEYINDEDTDKYGHCVKSKDIEQLFDNNFIISVNECDVAYNGVMGVLMGEIAYLEYIEEDENEEVLSTMHSEHGAVYVKAKY